MSAEIKMLVLTLLLCLVADAVVGSRFKQKALSKQSVVINSEKAKELTQACLYATVETNTVPCCHIWYCYLDMKIECNYRDRDFFKDALARDGLGEVRCVEPGRRRNGSEPHGCS